MAGGQIVYGLIALVCVALLVRLALPAAKRQRLDHWLRSTWGRMVAKWRGRHQRAASASHQAAQARQETDAAIERARRAARLSEVSRNGNVYTPESFKGPRKRP